MNLRFHRAVQQDINKVLDYYASLEHPRCSAFTKAYYFHHDRSASHS